MRTASLVILMAAVVWAQCSSDDKPVAPSSAYDGLFINEILAANDAGVRDPDFDRTADWIEIYNAGSSQVDLEGMYLTDDLEQLLQWEIPAGAVVPASGFLVFWADKEDTALSGYHTNFKLSKDGEQVGLFTAEGVQIDALTFGEQETDVSYGRVPDGGMSWQSLEAPSPGAQNN